MKHTLLLLAGVAWLVLAKADPAYAQPRNANYHLYFPLASGDLDDDDGNATLTQQGGWLWGPDREGNPNSALSTFNGHLVGTDMGAVTDADGFTLDLWVRYDGNSGRNAQFLFDTRADDGFGEGYFLVYEANQDRLRFTTADGGPYHDVFAAWTPTVGEWTRITVTVGVTGRQRKIYIDGIDASGADNDFASTTDMAASMTLGGYIGTSPASYYFAGAVDDITFFRGPLSPTDVAQLWDDYDYYFPLADGDLMDEDGQLALTASGQSAWTADRDGTADAAFVSSAGQLSGQTGVSFAQTTGFTVDLWVRYDGTASRASQFLFDNRLADGFGNGYFLVYERAQQRLRFTSAAGTYRDVFAPWTPTAGQWTRITAVLDRDNQERVIYIDGQRASGADNSYTLSNGLSTVTTFGGYVGTTPAQYYFDGAIDDINLFERALTAAEVVSLWAPDTQDPTAPTDLRHTMLDATTARIAWDAATDNVGVDNYLVFWGGHPTREDASVLSVDVPVADGQTYTFAVEAYDAAGNASPRVSYTFTAGGSGGADTEAPSAVSDLRISNTVATELGFAWTAATDNVGVTDYEVTLTPQQASNTFPVTFRTNGSVTTSRRSLIPNTTYSVSVVALDAAGNVGPAAVLTARTAYSLGNTLAGGLTMNWLFDSNPHERNFGRSFEVSDRSPSTGQWYSSGRQTAADALDLSRSGQHVIESPDLDQSQSFTISMWARFERVNGTDRFVLLDGKDGSGDGIFVGVEQDTFGDGTLWFNGSPFHFATFRPYRYELFTFVCQYDNQGGGLLQVFVDDVELAPAVDPGVPPTPFTPLVDRVDKTLALGHLNAGSAGAPYGAFPGSVDQVAVYQRALSGSEIAQLYLNRDTRVPSLVTSVQASNVTANSIDLSWTQATDDNGLQDVWLVTYEAGSGRQQQWVLGNPATTLTGLTANTAYTVVVRALDWQGNLGAGQDLTFSTNNTSSVGAAAFAKTLTLAPNPLGVGEDLVVAGIPADARVYVLDAYGRTVRELPPADGHLARHVGALPTGLYLVRVEVTGAGSATRKLVVE